VQLRIFVFFVIFCSIFCRCSNTNPRCDVLVDDCLLIELKAVEILHPSSKAQLFSYMKLLDIPVGLLINFHEAVLKNGISRMILPGENRTEESEESEVSV